MICFSAFIQLPLRNLTLNASSFKHEPYIQLNSGPVLPEVGAVDTRCESLIFSRTHSSLIKSRTARSDMKDECAKGKRRDGRGHGGQIQTRNALGTQRAASVFCLHKGPTLELV